MTKQSSSSQQPNINININSSSTNDDVSSATLPRTRTKLIKTNRNIKDQKNEKSLTSCSKTSSIIIINGGKKNSTTTTTTTTNNTNSPKVEENNEDGSNNDNQSEEEEEKTEKVEEEEEEEEYDCDNSNNDNASVSESEDTNNNYDSSSSSWSNSSKNSWNDVSFSSSSCSKTNNDNDNDAHKNNNSSPNERGNEVGEAVAQRRPVVVSNTNSFSSSDENQTYDDGRTTNHSSTNNTSRMRVSSRQGRHTNNDNDSTNERNVTRKDHGTTRRYYKKKRSNGILTRRAIVNSILVVSILFWSSIQYRYYRTNTNDSRNSHTGNSSVRLQHTRKYNNHPNRPFSPSKVNAPPGLINTRQKLEEESKAALGSAAFPSNGSPTRNRQRPYTTSSKRSRGGSKEKAPDGCHYTAWQLSSLSNCMDVHTIPLPYDLGIQPRRTRHSNTHSIVYNPPPEYNNTLFGYVGSGLWRDVFKLPASPLLFKDEVVLKMMKLEHAQDERNIDRHRRDALVMERLASHPNIITSYAYCGSSSIAEYFDLRLDSFLYPDTDQRKDWNDDDSKKGTLLTNMDQKEDMLVSLSRETESGRINLALQISKALMALHSTTDGPIVHADIQTKQFLIDRYDTNGARVILSDFNRCRFMATKNNSTTPATTTTNNKYCSFRIPSAPGKHRSPEEYTNQPNLTDKLDIFSLAHVFYTILTGLPAIPTLQAHLQNPLTVKRSIVNGITPLTVHPNSTTLAKKSMSDGVLFHILERMYTLDHVARISAREIVHILENLLVGRMNHTTTSA